MDRIFFIKNGEFEMTKVITKVNNREKNTDSTKFVDGSKVDYSKFKQ
jgi:hypothetical protein